MSELLLSSMSIFLAFRSPLTWLETPHLKAQGRSKEDKKNAPNKPRRRHEKKPISSQQSGRGHKKRRTSIQL
jgi:hypothetical protein